MSHQVFRPVLWHQPVLWIAILWVLTLLLLMALNLFVPSAILVALS